jgi:class 3 adenylate cyclase/YHS domain-containing protein
MQGEHHTFLFADLAGFTALTEAHGDREAADLVGEFVAEVRALLDSHAAREVKTIGDALMIVGADAAESIRLGLRVAHEIGDCHGMPSVRVGMHTGPAVERDGDFIGATVNVAARISATAGGSQVVLSAATGQAAGSMADTTLRALGVHAFKNVREPLTLYEARWSSETTGGEGLPIDPVCRMAVDPIGESGRITVAGTEFHFCSLECARAFTSDPARYTTP